MKLQSLIAPTTLLTAGVWSQSATAAEYIATDAGTPITLAGAAQPQYTFDIDPDLAEIGTKTYIKGNGGALVLGPNDLLYSSQSQTREENPIFTRSWDGNYDLLFSANGLDYQGVASVVDQGTRISNITFTPLASGVPEPETWAMMILGLGAVGAAMRSQRRRQRVPATA